VSWTITGREGFIGSHLIERTETESGGVFCHLDALTGIQESLEKPSDTFSRNVANTIKWLESARYCDRPFVFASSAAAANPTNPYAASKASCEAWCQAYRHSYGLHVSILRFANVYGPGSSHKTSCVAQMCKDALEHGKIYVHGGEQCRDFVYVDDVVQAIIQHPDGLHGVRTGTTTELSQVAQALSELSGAKVVKRGEPLGADAPIDDSPVVGLDYLPLGTGLKRTYTWFYEQHKTRHI